MPGIEAEDRDDMIRALLDERSRARDDEHRKEIDEQLALRGYKAKADAKAEPGDASEQSAAEQRKAAADSAKDNPQGRKAPGKQTA